MLHIFSFILFTKLLLISLGVFLLFGIKKKEEKITSISWSVPVPPSLLAQLREFSPLTISRTSGMYLDDVFDLLKGERERTSPEVIEKLRDTLQKLRKHDEELEREAAKLAYMMRGLDAIEQREIKKRESEKSLPEPNRK